MILNIGLVGPLPPPYGGMANQANQLYQLLQQGKADSGVLLLGLGQKLG